MLAADRACGRLLLRVKGQCVRRRRRDLATIAARRLGRGYRMATFRSTAQRPEYLRSRYVERWISFGSIG